MESRLEFGNLKGVRLGFWGGKLLFCGLILKIVSVIGFSSQTLYE